MRNMTVFCLETAVVKDTHIRTGTKACEHVYYRTLWQFAMPRVGHLKKFRRDQHRTTSTSSMDYYYDSDPNYDGMPPLEEDGYICPDCRTDKKCEYCQDRIDSQNSF